MRPPEFNHLLTGRSSDGAEPQSIRLSQGSPGYSPSPGGDSNLAREVNRLNNDRVDIEGKMELYKQ